MDNYQTPSKIDLRYTNDKVIFYFCNCSLNKGHSFYGLSRTEAEKLIKKLQHIEQMTWAILISLGRESGLTSERSGSSNFEMIGAQDYSGQQLVEPHYFHFRVEPKGLFRVFGYQQKQFFCITHIDPQGKLNH